MARKKSPTLTDGELRLMEVLWRRGPSSVATVAADLPKLAYSTVMTMLRILEDKGYLRHTKEGRAFVYHPLVDRTEAGSSAVRYILSRFFRNSPELLLLNLLKNEKIEAKELSRLKKLVAESE
jgi:predicted transcriptional regulator